MGCCCVPLFTARNIVRYQYRIKPTLDNCSRCPRCDSWPSKNECIEECLLPTIFYYLGQFVSYFVFGQNAYKVGVILSAEYEVKLRKTIGRPNYLIGFDPSQNEELVTLQPGTWN